MRLAGVDPATRAGLARLRARACWLFNAAGFCLALRPAAAAGRAAAQPARLRPGAPSISPSTPPVSFVTNTNWQSYGGETTMSHLVQMAGLTVQNFVSAATGIALAIALVRAFARAECKTVGNFWVDMTRAHALRAAAAVASCSRWCWSHSACRRRSMPPSTRPRSKAPSRPSRSARSPRQIAIKQLGTNGGGFFNVNAAHPFENPNAICQLPRRSGRSS